MLGLGLITVPLLTVFGLILPPAGVLLAIFGGFTLTLSGLMPVLGEIGSLKVRPHDPLLIAAAIRVVVRWGLMRGQPRLGAVAPLVGYLVLLVTMLGVSAARLGVSSAAISLPALLRLCLEATVAPFIAVEIAAGRPAAGFRRALFAFVVVAVASVFAARVFLELGLAGGEAFSVEGGPTRAFGFFGDQVAFLLSFASVWAAVEGRPIAAAASLIALVLTGGLGASATLFISLVALGAIRKPLAVTDNLRTLVSGRSAFLSIAGGALVAVGGFAILWTRLSDASLLTTGSGFQRLFTLGLAIDVLRTDGVLGIGFLRFSDVALASGASVLFDVAKESGQFTASYVMNASNQYLQAALDAGVAGVVMLALLLGKSANASLVAARNDPGPLAPLLTAGFAWVVGLALGNQAAVWVLPGSLLFLLFCVLIGMAAGRGLDHVSSALPDTGQ